jgi:geranylgeranyl pyrophosphate synthase
MGIDQLTSTKIYLPEIRQEIEAVENLMLAQAAGYNDELKSALKLLLASGGKRIRPTIILLLGSILNTDYETKITLASAIELLHTATLVHDDLIDGSLLRRGVPTLNSKWAPAATVLTGDFIFASAALLAAKTNSIEMMKLFSKTLMIIVNGEVNQQFTSKCNVSKEDYYQRIYAKTASLFEASTHGTAIISNAPVEQIEKMRRFGYELGMAFQIVDDVLDYSGDPNVVGKPVGGDLRQGLITLPMLYYIESNPKDEGVQELLRGNCIKKDETVDRLIRSISSSSAIEQSLIEAEQYAHRALDLISSLPESGAKEQLIQLAESSIVRKK